MSSCSPHRGLQSIVDHHGGNGYLKPQQTSHSQPGTSPTHHWLLRSRTSASFNSDGTESSDDEEQEATNRLLSAVMHKPISRQRSWGLPYAPKSHHHHGASRLSVEELKLDTEVQPRVRSSYHLASGQAAVELFLRLSRARQTVEFSRRQALQFTIGAHGRMSIWDALNLLNELREYEAVLFKSSSGGAATPSPRSSIAGNNTTRQTGTSSSGGAERGSGGSSAYTSVSTATQADNTAPCVPAPPSTSGAAGQGRGDTGLMTMMEHAFQTAELCRLHFPDKPHLHLAGLIHGLGKLLAHCRFGAQPQWAVCGETWPLGCRFASCIPGSAYFSANPDRRRRLYSTPTGMYQPFCGLDRVVMSWGAPEYLYQVLSSNTCCHLPAEALFVLRHQKFYALSRSSHAYAQLLSAQDQEWLPVLKQFQEIIEFKRDCSLSFDMCSLRSYYDELIQKYTPGQLAW